MLTMYHLSSTGRFPMGEASENSYRCNYGSDWVYTTERPVWIW